MYKRKINWVVAILIIAAILFFSKHLKADLNDEAIGKPLDMQQAIRLAQKHDPLIQASVSEENAYRSKSISAGTLPDPMVSLNLANIDTDTYDLKTQAMSQVKIGFSQSIPRGDTLDLQRQKLDQHSQEYIFVRLNRIAEIQREVGSIWLDLYAAEKSIDLIMQNKVLFEQLTDLVQSSYSTGVGKTRQQDMIRAELELTRLKDQLTDLQRQKQNHLIQLQNWLKLESLSGYLDSGLKTNQQNQNNQQNQFAESDNLKISLKLPVIDISNTQLLKQDVSRQYIMDLLMQHPKMQQLNLKVEAGNTQIAIEEQKYKPSWNLNSSYGYRESDPFGNERADLFSIGVSFDVPLFTGNKQDKDVESAVFKQSSIKSQRTHLFKTMLTGLENAKSNYLLLKERQALYQNHLLPQMSQQAEASINAYTNDIGDFAEVVRARIADLNAQIQGLNIDVEVQKTALMLNYFLAATHPQQAIEMGSK
ncbi:MAG: TolC family protein [Gammaproteobacteria bacterium]|nr:TolC family protein [Gammaproteobacteria bacterium]